ncbi:glutathione S-transferase family protein [Lonepinella koalarum]|uniref:Glutathione S-transferase n=1 Tax=Lonepinella koalarum TaxID=53417 RepID=A0A4R1KZH5_9PAST|nr:glutathione S-transferase family protein [Lonepinella koalarum]MDH2925835.1 glutathione S-transferase [Lonepinella koalarum]TCK70988.1 glutathione S-transferase [Lonepinella koalarum]TFJ90722.1 glutathione S-transferase family protein [Lonepinella koalarum]
MKLYYLKGSCSTVPHIALEWIGQPYEAVEMSREAIKQADYLALNPQGSVPLLVDGDFALSQNVAILTYLDNLYPDAKIFGSKTVQDKAKATKWLAFCNADIHPIFGRIFNVPTYLQGNEELIKQYRQELAERLLRLYAIADEYLSQHQFFGEQISVADVYLYITLRWSQAIGLDYSHLHHLTAHYQRVGQNAGVQSVLKQQGLPA